MHLKGFAIIVLILILGGCKKHSFTVIDEAGNPIEGAIIYSATEMHGIQSSSLTKADGSQYFDVFNFQKDSGHVFTIYKTGYLSKTLRDPSQEHVTVRLKQDDNPIDEDNDGLSYHEETLLGLDPFNPDTDEDSIPDGREVRLFEEGPAIIVAPVNPKRKNILLEIDWVASEPSTKISDLGVRIVKSVFANAPIYNPDGSTGIDMIVDRGEYGGGEGLNIDPYFTGSAEELVELTGSSSNPYLFHTLSVAEIDNGALYGWAAGKRHHVLIGQLFKWPVVDSVVEALGIMHELGHNLGLQHGGDDNILCKPNYPSVMNYNPILQLTSLGYSTGSHISLDESSLNEELGLGKEPIDWNENGVIDSEPVTAQINHFSFSAQITQFIDDLPLDNVPLLNRAFGQDRCPPGDYDLLNDHNDWAVIEGNLSEFVEFASSGGDYTFDESYPVGNIFE